MSVPNNIYLVCNYCDKSKLRIDRDVTLDAIRAVASVFLWGGGE